MTDQPAPTEPSREIVIRLRRRRPVEDWRLGRVLTWAATALAGDPVLLLAPLFMLVVAMLWVFAIGAPARADVLMPLVSLPPVDAFLDVGAIAVAERSAGETWILRAVALALRTVTFGVLIALATQRAKGMLPSLSDALRTVRDRVRTLAFLELLSFGLFGVTLTLSADLASARDDGAIGTALLFGVLVLAGPFIAAAGGMPAGTAVRAGNRWIRRRPLGQVLLVLLYGIGSNGLFRLAAAGEPGTPRAFPLTLYAFAASLVTMWLLLAFARRHVLLYQDDPGH